MGPGTRWNQSLLFPASLHVYILTHMSWKVSAMAVYCFCCIPLWNWPLVVELVLQSDHPKSSLHRRSDIRTKQAKPISIPVITARARSWSHASIGTHCDLRQRLSEGGHSFCLA